MYHLQQGWASIFTCGPYRAFLCVLRPRFKSNMTILSLKQPFEGQMLPAGRMLPPPDLQHTFYV